MLKQQILSRKYGNISSVLGEIFLPYFLKKLYIMHTPEKDKFWQSRGQRFDPAMLGHYSAGFTLDTYAHVTTDAQLKAAQTMGNILSRVV